MSLENFSGKDDEALRIENELLKLKILAEKGLMGKLIINGDEVPPDVENEFLKFLSSLEDDVDDTEIEMVPIYDFIGKPDFIHEKDLTDEQLPAELERVNSLLFEMKIIYSVLGNVENRMIYKFVTEDLFQHEILNMPDSEIGSHYFYEDFHPDHEFSSQNKCVEFLNYYISDDIGKFDQFYHRDELRNYDELSLFHNAMDAFRNLNYEFIKENVVPEKCVRKATVSFDAVASQGTEPIHFSGEAVFELEFLNDRWQVVAVKLPGM